jgi:hypothetical protein
MSLPFSLGICALVRRDLPIHARFTIARAAAGIKTHFGLAPAGRPGTRDKTTILP